MPKCSVSRRWRFQDDWIYGYWKKKGHSHAECSYLMQVMKKEHFEICYPLEESPKEYIVPQLLPDQRPQYDWDERQNLQFRYVYPFLPEGIIARLIVRLQQMLANDAGGNDIVWKTGAVFAENKARAEVIQGLTKDGRKSLNIRACGEERRRKDLLGKIRSEIDRLHRKSFNDIPMEQMIPCYSLMLRAAYLKIVIASRRTRRSNLRRCSVIGLLRQKTPRNDKIGAFSLSA